MARDLIAEYFTDLAGLRALLGYGAGFPTDTDLTRIATAVCRYFERRARTYFVPVTETRRYCGDGTRTLRLDRPVITITTITASGSDVDASANLLSGPELGGVDSQAWHRDPRLVLAPEHNATTWPRPSYRDVPNVLVAGTWGTVEGDADAPETPAAVLEALLRTIGDNAAPPADLDLRLAKRAPAAPTMSGGGRTTHVNAAGRGKIVVDPLAEQVLREYAAPLRMRSTL